MHNATESNLHGIYADLVLPFLVYVVIGSMNDLIRHFRSSHASTLSHC